MNEDPEAEERKTDEQDVSTGFWDGLFQKMGIDPELAEWFLLSVLFGAIPLFLAICFRRWNHTAAIDVPANIPEFAFLTIIAALTSAGDIRKVVTNKVRSPVLTICFWLLVGGAVICSAFLGVHLWIEASNADDLHEAVKHVSESYLHGQPRHSAMESLTFAEMESAKSEIAEQGMLQFLKGFASATIALSVIAELFVARARAAQKGD